MNRRGEVERFIRASGLPLGERAVMRDLVGCADNVTGEILPEHEWKTSLELIAGRIGAPKSNVVLWLGHLERHSVIRRDRSAGGQGNLTRYTLLPPGAERCTCPSRKRDEPKTAAQRMREYRRRQRAASGPGQPEAAPPGVTTHGPFERSVARNENGSSPAVPHLSTAPRRGWEGTGVNDDTSGEPSAEAAEAARGRSGLPPLPGESGPCRECRQPCTRYGPAGGPLCAECASADVSAGGQPLADDYGWGDPWGS